MKTKALVLSLFFLLFSAGNVSADTTFSIADNFSPANLFGSVGELATDIILTLTSVAAAACFIVIIISGIKIITAGGDPKKLASAQSTITYAIIGIAIVILAFVIVRVVQYFIGSTVPI